MILYSWKDIQNSVSKEESPLELLAGSGISIGSFDGLKDYTIILNGFSKSFAMTGWRIGYIAAPKDLMAESVKLHQ